MLQVEKALIPNTYVTHLPEVLQDCYEFGSTVIEALELLIDSINTTNEMLDDFEYTAYIYYHEYDINKERPVLVVQGDMSSIGYSVNIYTFDVDVVCLCAATNENECVCEYQYEKK